MTTIAPVKPPELTEARKKFLHGVFTTACEGGIQYWAALDEYHWIKNEVSEGDIDWDKDCDLDGFYATLMPTADEGCWGIWNGPKDVGALRLNLNVIERGVRLFRRYCHGELDSSGRPVLDEHQKAMPDGHYWRQFLVAEATHGEDGDYDAEVADQIVQWGLFGMGIYG